MLAPGQGSILGIDPGHDLVTQVGVVAPGGRRVHELAAAERGPAVHPYQDARWSFSPGEKLIGQFRKVLPEGRAVAPHVELARQALYHVNRWVAPRWLLVVARRQVDPDGPRVWVAQGVIFEDLACEDSFFVTSAKFERPWIHLFRPFPIFSDCTQKQHLSVPYHYPSRISHQKATCLLTQSCERTGRFTSRESGVARGSRPLAGVRGVPAKTFFSCFSFVACGDKRKTGRGGQSATIFKWTW